MASLAEQLASVQAAIAAIESGAQSFADANGRSVTRADLRVLYAREKELLKRQTRAARGGMRVRQGVPL